MNTTSAVIDAASIVCGRNDITENMSLIDDLGFDSLDIVEFEILLEEKFEQDFDIRSSKIYTIADVVRCIGTSTTTGA